MALDRIYKNLKYY
jgi:subtilisin family serine protease